MANIDRAAEPARRPALPARLGDLGQTYGLLAALVALILFNVFFTQNFLTVQTVKINLIQVATIVIVATGMALVVATGGIDLSVGSLMAISGALAPLIFLNPALANNLALANALAFVVPVLVTGLFGAFNGLLVTAGRATSD